MAIPLAGLTAISNGDSLDAVPVDGNFDTIVSHINTEMIARDGSIAMTGQLSLVGDPSSASDAARKAYVDAEVADAVPPTAKWVRDTNTAVTSSTTYVTWQTETNDTDGWWSSGTTLTCPADGVYAISFYAKKDDPSGGDDAIIRLVAGSGSATVFGGMTAQSDAGDSDAVVVGGVFFLPSGQTIRAGWSKASSGSMTMDQAVLTITRLALI